MNIKILILSILALLMSCKGNKQNEQKIAAFKKQKHRFEFKGCDMYYNEQKVELYKPKSYYIKLFGDGFDKKKEDFHTKIPIFLNMQYWKKSTEPLVVELKIIFKREPEQEYYDRFYNEMKHLPTFKEGEYILIDGVAFGYDISFKELNTNLHSKGKYTFKRVFTYYSRAFGCKYRPLQAIFYKDNSKKKLSSFSYSFEDSENKLNVK